MKRKAQINRQLKRETREKKEQQHFVGPLTGKRARHIAGAQAGTEYSPVIRSIAAEKRGSVKRQKQIGSAYQGLNAEIAANAQKASEGSAATNATITQRLQESGAQSQSQLNNLASQDSATAKLLGGPSNAAGTAQMAAGNSARAQQLVALTAPNTAAGASYANYLRQRGTSARERGMEATGAERDRRLKIKEDLRAAKKQRGQAKVANLSKLRSEERDYRIQNRAFPLEKQEAAAEARQDSITNRQNQEKINETRRHNQQGEKGGGGLTPSEKHTRQKEKKAAKRELNDAKSAANDLYRAYKSEGKPPKGATQWSNFVDLVVKKSGADYSVARRIVKKIRGRVEAENAAPSPLG